MIGNGGNEICKKKTMKEPGSFIPLIEHLIQTNFRVWAKIILFICWTVVFKIVFGI